MTPDEFSKYRHDTVHALIALNDGCERNFRLSAWPRWDYDFGPGTLTFSQDGVAKVIASIQVVGTTSEIDNTWLWSWANDSIPSNVTSAMCEVRAFGQSENLNELVNANSPCDEHFGWEMTAIAARILDAVGAYRCPGKNGFLYLVYTDLSFAILSDVKSAIKHVTCDQHGQGYEAFVCEHLLSNPEQVWFSDQPSEENRSPDAWCAVCDAVWQQKQAWDDGETISRIRVLCHRCYESLRSRSKP